MRNSKENIENSQNCLLSNQNNQKDFLDMKSSLIRIFPLNNQQEKMKSLKGGFPNNFDNEIKEIFSSSRSIESITIRRKEEKKVTTKSNKSQFQVPINIEDLQISKRKEAQIQSRHDSKFETTKSALAKKIHHRVFWEQEKIERFRAKFLIAKNKILKKTSDEIGELKNCIIDKNEDRVLEIMHNRSFKKFYKQTLVKSDILSFILKNNQPDLLIKILKDDFYKFDQDQVFKYIIKLMKNKNSKEDKNIFSMIVKYKLFNEGHSDILAYFAALFKLFEAFNILTSKTKIFKTITKSIIVEEDLDKIEEDKRLFYDVLDLCLFYKFEELSISMVKYAKFFDNPECLKTAIHQSCIIFFQEIWELSFEKKEKSDINLANRSMKSNQSYRNSSINYSDNQLILRKSLFGESMGVNREFNNGVIPFSLSVLVEKFADLKNYGAITKILKWKYIEKDDEFLQKLFDFNCFEQIHLLIQEKNSNLPWKLNKEMLKSVIENEELDLILFLLRKSECRVILEDVNIQKRIVDRYLKFGNKIYYGAEVLSYLNNLTWKNQLSIDVCKNIMLNLKNKDIINCHSPILTCLLICEFLKMVSSISILNISRCEKTMKELLELSKNLQTASSDESYIKFIMTQKDTKGRSCLQIASENNFLEVLQIPEIGIIVGKMWNGNINHNGFLTASSFYRYLGTVNKSSDPFLNFDVLDSTKNYFFQLDVWTDSCSLRFWPESISTVILIIIYNLYIWNLAANNIIQMNYQDYSVNGYENLLNMLYVYTVWNIIIVFNILNQYIFMHFAKRKFRIDFWQVFDIITLIFNFLLFLDLKEIIGKGFQDDLVGLARAGILAANDIFVWMRITGILLTFKDVGPLIGLIYELSAILAKFIVIYGLWVICCSAILTSIFFNSSKMFTDYSISVFYLIGFFIQNFNLTNFSKYQIMGQVLMMIFITFSGILLINLLIAMLSSTYEETNKMVDANHRTTIISYHRRYKWDSNYGYLIFLTTPLNIVNFLIFPFTLLFNEKSRIKINLRILKCYFFMYFLFILFIYILFTSVIFPFCYFKALIKVFSSQFSLSISFSKKVINILKWFFLGFPFLIYVLLRDVVILILTAYRKIEENNDEISRIKTYIQPNDVITFLQFIHGRNKDKSQDMHQIFLEYLEFEQNKINENNQKNLELKENQKLMTRKKTLKENVIKNIANNKSSTNYMKKNFIILEILENFLVDINEFGELVDIDKMKMLLPRTVNVNEAYIKRIVFTDINSLNKALNKLKQKKEIFQQFQLVNKISRIALKIDKEIDLELFKNLRKKNFDHQKNFQDLNLEDHDYLSGFFSLMEKINTEMKTKRKVNNPQNI